MSMNDRITACGLHAVIDAGQGHPPAARKEVLHLLQGLPIHADPSGVRWLTKRFLMELAAAGQPGLGQRNAKAAAQVAGQVDQRRGRVVLARRQVQIGHGRNRHEQERRCRRPGTPGAQATSPKATSGFRPLMSNSGQRFDHQSQGDQRAGLHLSQAAGRRSASSPSRRIRRA